MSFWHRLAVAIEGLKQRERVALGMGKIGVHKVHGVVDLVGNARGDLALERQLFALDKLHLSGLELL